MTDDDALQQVLDAITLPTADEFAAMYEAAMHPAPLPPGTPMCEAPDCRRPLPPPGRRGPRRRTCGNACRVRRWRADRAILAEQEALVAALQRAAPSAEELAALLADPDGPDAA